MIRQRSSVAPPSSPAGPRNGAAIAMAGLVGMAALAAHWPALSAKALSFDDQQYLTRNFLVQHPSWHSARRFLSEVLEPSTVDGYYQPLTMISLMLDCAAGGSPTELRPFHRTSLALHAVNAALATFLLHTLFGNVWAAALAGLVFAVHPMTVEPIPWVGERKTLLAALFALVSLIAYVGYARRKGLSVRVRGPGSRAGLYYGVSLAAFLLALLAKPTVTPLPLVLLLMDVWPLGRVRNTGAALVGRPASKGDSQRSAGETRSHFQHFILEKIPFLVLMAVFAYITYESQRRTSGASLPTEHSVWRVPLILCHNIVFYLWKIAVPMNLSSHYAFPDPLSLSNGPVLAGVIGTGLLLPLLAWSTRRTPAFAVGWLIFFIAILPTMQIIGFSNVIASDKYAYFPAIGLLMILAWGLDRLWHAPPHRRAAARAAAILGVSVAALLYAAGTRRYLPYWSDTETLFRHMLRLTPNAAPLHDTLGTALAEKGRIEEARREWLRALEIWPHLYSPRYNLGLSYRMEGRIEEAEAAFRDAIARYPAYVDAHNNLGSLLAETGRVEEAMLHFRRALQLCPDDPDANYNLGVALLQTGRKAEAAEHLQAVLKYRPDDAEAQAQLRRARS